MGKVDKRINYIIGLDTETCNSFEVDGKVDLSQSIVYDIGWVITDKKARIYEKRSFLIYEVFVGMKDVMRSAYYADKISTYWEEIKQGTRKLVRFDTMYKQFWADVQKYGIRKAFAHNARFDLNALNNTIRFLTKSKKRFFFPRKIEIYDTLKMARQTIGKQKSYRKFCKINNFVTKHSIPQPRFTAEVLYRYITGDVTFEENHTGLEDVLIETAIYAHCVRQHKKMDGRLFKKVA